MRTQLINQVAKFQSEIAVLETKIGALQECIKIIGSDTVIVEPAVETELTKAGTPKLTKDERIAIHQQAYAKSFKMDSAIKGWKFDGEYTSRTGEVKPLFASATGMRHVSKDTCLQVKRGKHVISIDTSSFRGKIKNAQGVVIMSV